MSQLKGPQMASTSDNGIGARNTSSPSPLASPAVRASLSSVQKRSKTPPNPLVTSAATSSGNGIPRPRSDPLLDHSRNANGEPAAKILRTGAAPAAAPAPAPREARNPPVRIWGESDESVHYERAVRTLAQFEAYRAETEASVAVAMDPSTPERSAELCRMPPTELTKEEIDAFPDVASGSEERRENHLLLRNSVLQYWLLDPKRNVLVDSVAEFLESGATAVAFERAELTKIVKFLNRHCYINFGDVTIGRSPVSLTDLAGRKHVIVLGAGISGLAAARQLLHFGFRVTVIEGRSRPGGRIETWTASGSKSNIAEKGAQLITGIEGNPIYTLAMQIGMKLEPLDMRCPIFEGSGIVVPPSRDDALDEAFSHLVHDSHDYIRTHYDAASSVPPPGMGQCVLELLRSREHAVAVSAASALDAHCEEIATVRDLYKVRRELHQRTTATVREYEQLTFRYPAAAVDPKNVTQKTRQREQVRLKTKLRELKKAIQDNDLDIVARETVNDVWSPDIKYYCFMADADRKVIGWHLANYDFANACCSEDLSLQHIVSDDESEFGGGHHLAPGGMQPLADRLCADTPILYNHKVTKVTYSQQKGTVTVAARTLYQTSKDLVADAVICTVPLGVLKCSAVQFDPPLSAPKLDAIRRLGFGVMNKVILVYPRKFWRVRRTIFGYASPEAEKRGEFFMFWGLHDQPILFALVAGKRAEVLEKQENSVIINACTQVLQNIFGKNIVGLPKESSVTRWGAEEFTRGSYSSVPVGASGADYDTLAEPILVDGVPRVCFAGEHTCRPFPGTLHGAFLSGLREATRLHEALGGVDNV